MMRLVPDWQECWKWHSSHAMWIGAAMIGAWNSLPQKMQDAFPPKYVLALAGVMFVLGFIGRLREQGKPPCGQ